MTKASVEVRFENPKHNYKTSVNPNQTDKQIKQYFVGQYFDVGQYPTENLQRCKSIVIHRS